MAESGSHNCQAGCATSAAFIIDGRHTIGVMPSVDNIEVAVRHRSGEGT